ncbi:MAG: hypothetical protein H7201_02560 [Candidatus Saccharibacteria bacterium]|nr:hypothetical protein [Microbacteriaceae bacterium]
MWLTIGLQPVGCCDEAWLQMGAMPNRPTLQKYSAPGSQRPAPIWTILGMTFTTSVILTGMPRLVGEFRRGMRTKN